VVITVSRCIEGVNDVHLREANPSQSAATSAPNRTIQNAPAAAGPEGGEPSSHAAVTAQQ
jgi:hypothetical protein